MLLLDGTGGVVKISVYWNGQAQLQQMELVTMTLAEVQDLFRFNVASEQRSPRSKVVSPLIRSFLNWIEPKCYRKTENVFLVGFIRRRGANDMNFIITGGGEGEGEVGVRGSGGGLLVCWSGSDRDEMKISLWNDNNGIKEEMKWPLSLPFLLLSLSPCLSLFLSIFPYSKVVRIILLTLLKLIPGQL